MENNTSTQIGKEIEKIVESYGSGPLMNQDNKDMLEKVKKQKTNEEVIQTLLADPKSGHCMSYAESRMRFG